MPQKLDLFGVFFIIQYFLRRLKFSFHFLIFCLERMQKLSEIRSRLLEDR